MKLTDDVKQRKQKHFKQYRTAKQKLPNKENLVRFLHRGKPRAKRQTQRLWETTWSRFCQLILISEFQMMYCLICLYQITVVMLYRIFLDLYLRTVLLISYKSKFTVCVNYRTLSIHPSFVVSVDVLITNIHKSRAVTLYLIKHRNTFSNIKSMDVTYYRSFDRLLGL